MRHAREWSAEIWSVSLQERSFLLPFYFYVLADKFLISCPVSIRIRNRVGLGLWSRHNTASGPNIYTATGCGQRHTEKTPRVLPHLTTCAAIVVYSIPNAGVHRRVGEQVSGTVRLCDPAPGEDELGFWEALCATAQIRHHGSSSVQVGRCYSSSYSSPSAADRRQHRHQHCRTHNS